MPPPTDATANPLVTLGNALSLVHRAMTLARQGLLKNPSKEDERELNETLNDLEVQRAALTAKLNALITGSKPVAGPTSAQVSEISRLTAQVGALTAAAVTASGAVALTSKVLTLATEIAAA